MKKSIIYLFLFVTCFCIAQKTPDFVTKFYFVDSKGNKDSIEVGFDENAIVDGTIQLEFGEVDISDKPFNKIFDIRIGKASNYKNNNIPYTKRKINNLEKCDIYGRARFAILVRANFFPITMSWNNNIFKDSCLKSSVFSRSSTVLLYETNEPTRRLLKDTSSLLINQKYMDGVSSGPIRFLADMSDFTQDSVQIFYMIIAKNRAGNVGIKDNILNNKVNIAPNPVSNELLFKFNENVYLPNNAKLYILNPNGQIITEQSINTAQTEVNVSILPAGLYFVQLRANKELLYTNKFFKVE